HTPQILLVKETLVVFFNLIGLGLMLSALMQPGARWMPVIGSVVGAGLVLKTAAALGRSANPFVWLTPGVSFGLLAGWLVLYALERLPRGARLVLALLCILIAA